MLDAIDQQLLGLLQDNCRLSYAELGEKVGLSISAVNERLKKLHGQGVIERFVALVSPAAVGLGLCAFVEVAITRPKRASEFLDDLRKRPEVLECHHTTSEYPLLLKIWTRDTASLEEFLNRHVRNQRGVAGTRISVVLSSPKQGTALPLPKREAKS